MIEIHNELGMNNNRQNNCFRDENLALMKRIVSRATVFDTSHLTNCDRATENENAKVANLGGGRQWCQRHEAISRHQVQRRFMWEEHNVMV